MTDTVLVGRLDSVGDLLLAGPAVRAVAAGADRVVLLCSPHALPAARLLPGIDKVLSWHCPWISAEPPDVRHADVADLLDQLTAERISAAAVLTSFHQSPLPMALLLRLAGVGRIGAVSTDYSGSLLDVRLRPDIDIPEQLPEPRRALAVVEALGFRLPPGDSGNLAVQGLPDVRHITGDGNYVVVHPGCSAPARTWPAHRYADLVAELSASGRRVLVTGGRNERDLTGFVAGARAMDLGGRTDLAQLASILAGADALVVGNTGPAHLAAAVGTPVVSLFAPVVPAAKWAPYGVPHVLLGDQHAPCRDSRARICPVPGHPCLTSVTVADVIAALTGLAAPTRHPVPRPRRDRQDTRGPAPAAGIPPSTNTAPR